MSSPEGVRCFSTSKSGAALAYHNSTTPSTTATSPTARSQPPTSPPGYERPSHPTSTPTSPTTIIKGVVRAIQKDVLSLKSQLACLRTEAVAASASNAQWAERMVLKWRQLVNNAPLTSSSPRMASSPRRSFARQQTPRQLKQIDYTPLSKLVKKSPPSSAPATARLRSPPSASVGGRVAERLLDVDRLIALRTKEKDVAAAATPSPPVAPPQPVVSHPVADKVRPTVVPSYMVPHHLAVADAEVVRWREGKDAEMLAASRSGCFVEAIRPTKHTARLERAFEEGMRPPTAPTAPPLPEHSHKWSLRATKQLHAAIVGESQQHQRVLPNPAPPPSAFLPIHQTQRQIGGTSAPVRRHVTSGSLVPIRTPRTPQGKFGTLSQPQESSTLHRSS